MFFLKLLTVVTLTSAFLGIWQNYYSDALFSRRGNYVVVFVYLAFFIVFSSVYDGFKIGIMRMHELSYSLSLSVFFANFFTYLVLCLIARRMMNPIPMAVLQVIQIFLIIVCIYALSHVYFCLYKARKTLAVFSPANRNDIIKKFSVIKERFQLTKGITVDKSLDEIKREIDDYEVIIICDFDKTLKAQILDYCYSTNKRIYMLPTATETVINGSYSVQVFDSPVLFLHNGGLSMEQRIIKRFFDILLSLIGIIITSPLMIVTAILIKLTSKGPVIFKQQRVTRDQRIFNIYKFRSMNISDDGEVKKTTVNDNRITVVGKVIRPLRIDELPQLFNIFLGDMSIVGPRPEMKELVDDYAARLPEFNLRHKVKTGLTGYAQIYGKYNTTPQNKLNMDLYYIEHYSLLEDIKLIVMTIKILFVRESTEGFSEKNSRLTDASQTKEETQ